MLTKQQIEAIVESAQNIGELKSIARSLADDVRSIVEPLIEKKIDDFLKQQGLRSVREVIVARDAEIKEWLVNSIPDLYVTGFNSAQKDAKKLGITGTDDIGTGKLTVDLLKSEAFLKPHLDAVNALLQDSYLDFANNMNGVVRGAERIINTAQKQQIRQGIAEGQLTGKSVKKVAAGIEDTIGQQGFSALIDRGGRAWDLETYSEMLARTHLIRSSTEGTINRASDFGVDLVRVSKHGNVNDELCLSQEGKIYSISGKSDTYPPLTGNEPPFHPNCRHTLEMFIDTE